MATGAPGTNGVWQYGEDDSEATFSELLNLAAGTTDTQIGLDRARLTTLEAPGRVIQTASVIKTNHFTTSSSSYTDIPGLSVTITPSSSSNRIAIFANVNFSSVTTSDCLIRLVRNSTEIAGATDGGTARGFAQYSSSYNLAQTTGSIAFVDLPATTSATTYKIQIFQVGGAGTATVNRRGSDANFGASSTIIVQELKY
jgi:hypothetical protein